MKKIFYLLAFCSLMGCTKAQQQPLKMFASSNQWPAPASMGNLIYDDFPGSSLSGSWTTSATANYTVSGGDLNLNGLVADGYNLNRTYDYTGYGSSCLESFIITVPFKVTEKSASCNGFFIGVKSTDAGSANWHLAQFNTNSGDGKIRFYMQGSTSATTTSSTALTFSLNDECVFILTRYVSGGSMLYRAEVDNITNPNSLVFTYTWGEAYPQTITTPPTSVYRLVSGVGQTAIHSFTVTSTYKKNCDDLAIGNSITRGYYSATVANLYTSRWASLLFTSSTKVQQVAAGPGDRTADVLLRINEMIALNARVIFLAIGGNDVSAGVAEATIESNFQSIYNQLKKPGNTIWVLAATPRNSTDMTTFNSFLSSTYGSHYIDVFTPLKDGGTGLNATYDCGDGVHPNTAGHLVISNTIKGVVPAYQYN